MTEQDFELLTPKQEERRVREALIVQRANRYYMSTVDGFGIDSMMTNMQEAAQKTPSPWTVLESRRLVVGWVTDGDREWHERLVRSDASAAQDLKAWAYRQLEARARAEVERDEALSERDEARNLAVDLDERLDDCQVDAQALVEALAEAERLRAEVEKLRGQIWRLTHRRSQDNE